MVRSSWLALGALAAAALVLAGCTANNGAPSLPTTVNAEQLTPAGARAMLASAAATMPDRYGMDLTLARGSATLLSLHGAFDNASGVSYAEITGDASAFSAAGGGQQSAAFAPYLAKGITLYATKDASLYYANGTAYVFPPASAGASSSSLVPSPQEGPLGSFMRPVNGPFKDVLAGDNVTVESVKPTVVHGKPAVEMHLRTTQGGQNLSALVDVFADPPRLAHVESTLPRQADAPQDPFGGATAVADFSYGDDVKVTPSATATRALALAYRSDANALSGWKGNATWTFLVSGGVLPSEVEAQVKDTSQTSAAQSMGFTDAPTKWALKLSEGSRTAEGVTLAFHDADADGKVGAGDSLTITTSGESGDGAPAPVVILKDLVTGAFVVPGAGLFVLVGALASAALVIGGRRLP